VRLESVPPTTVISLSVNWLVESLSVKKIVAVSPALSAGTLLVTVAVGTIVSITSAGESRAAVLPLPAASVNALAPTKTEPGVVEFTVGVKIAV
jgi:hypothetical protein